MVEVEQILLLLQSLFGCKASMIFSCPGKIFDFSRRQTNLLDQSPFRTDFIILRNFLHAEAWPNKSIKEIEVNSGNFPLSIISVARAIAQDLYVVTSFYPFKNHVHTRTTKLGVMMNTAEPSVNPLA